MIEADIKSVIASLERESRYIQSLQSDFSDRENFRDNIQRISALCKKRSVNTDQMVFFVNSSDTGKIYVILDPNQHEMLKSLFNLIISGSTDRDAVKETLHILYKNVMDKDNSLSLLFEISILKSFMLQFSINRDKIDNPDRVFKNSINMLRDILIEVRNEINAYNIFNREFHAKILDVASISQSTGSRFTWDTFRTRINAAAMPYSLFTDLAEFYATASSLEKELDIIEFFESKTIWTIDDISAPPHTYYLPFLREEVRSVIVKTISKKSKQTRDYLLKEQQDLDRQLLQIKNDIKESMKSFSEELNSEVDSSLQYPVNVTLIKKINSFIIDFNRNIMANLLTANRILERYGMLKKKMMMNEQLRNVTYEQLMDMYRKQGLIEESDVMLSIFTYNDYSGHFQDLFEQYKKYLVQVAKKSYDTLKNSVKEGDKKAEEDILLMQNIFKDKMLSKQFNYDFVRDKYNELMSAIENDVLIDILINSIRIYNIEAETDRIKKQREAFFVMNFLLPNKKVFLISKDRNPVPSGIMGGSDDIAKILKGNFSKTVSSLVYDIRGSSFMSSKLNNADKQKFIMKKFQSSMNNAVRNGFGIPVKETGDGGIVLFCNNAKELYRNMYKESVSTKNISIRHSIATGADISIKETPEAPKQGIMCAINMVKAAEKFIEDNYMNYREWFFDVQEKKVIHEGIEYALLPPSFKTLFRIGVGISSGLAKRDIEMNINAFGDIDVYGSSINEAKVFSGGKDPSSSVIIIDHISLFSLILNAEYFEHENKPDPENIITGISSENSFSSGDLSGIENLKVKFYGIYFPFRDKNNVMEFDRIPESFDIDESGRIFYDGQPVKMLYQVII